MKKVVVTCITGDYDSLKEPILRDESYRYICFTDAPERYKSDVWEILPLPEDVPHIDRKIKMLTHKYVDFDICIWVDGSIWMKNNKITEFEELLVGNDILVKQHMSNNNIGTEIQLCHSLGRGNPEIIQKQQLAYTIAGKTHLNVYALGVMVKKNTNAVKNIMELWWEEYQKYPSRDQLSFPIALERSERQHVVVAYEWKMLMPYFNVCEHRHANGLRLSRDVEKRTTTWWDFVPYDQNKDLGKKINEFCAMVPDNDWILIRDGDTAYLQADYGHLIQSVIEAHKEVDLFGCYTNRLGLFEQVPFQAHHENYDMTFHTMTAQYMRLKHGNEVYPYYANIAGLFMLFNKQVWEQIKFTDKIIDDGGYLDYHFTSEVIRRGGNVAMIPGLYIYHNYRILHGSGARYINSHLK